MHVDREKALGLIGVRVVVNFVIVVRLFALEVFFELLRWGRSSLSLMVVTFVEVRLILFNYEASRVIAVLKAVCDPAERPCFQFSWPLSFVVARSQYLLGFS